MVLYITIYVQRNNVAKSALVKLEEGITYHARRESKCCIYKHCIETGQRTPISMVLKLQVVTVAKIYLNTK